MSPITKCIESLQFAQPVVKQGLPQQDAVVKTAINIQRVVVSVLVTITFCACLLGMLWPPVPSNIAKGIVDLISTHSAHDSSGSQSIQQVQLFVGVLSASGNSDRRDAIRQTWAAHPQLARVVFIINRPASALALQQVSQEAMQTRDILLLHEILEHDHNITYLDQTLEIFRAAYAFQGPITHVMKCDDDSYVHVTRLLQFLADIPSNQAYAWAGLGQHQHKSLGPTANKWYVSSKGSPQNVTNFQYTFGPGYVLTKALVDILATGAVSRCGAPGTKLKVEEAALGHWLQCLQHEHSITIFAASSDRFGSMRCKEGDLVSHDVTPDLMSCMYARQGGCCNATVWHSERAPAPAPAQSKTEQ